jgi:hypothetical protein
MKKTLTAITLAMTLAFGATIANAESGIIIGDQPTPCTATDGIIIGDMFTTIVNTIEGIIIGDTANTDPCTAQTDGIIIGD